MPARFLSEQGRSLIISTPYDKGFVDALKRDVPARSRAWDARSRSWRVSTRYRNRVERLIRRFYLAGESPVTPDQAGAMNESATILELRRLLGLAENRARNAEMESQRRLRELTVLRQNLEQALTVTRSLQDRVGRMERGAGGGQDEIRRLTRNARIQERAHAADRSEAQARIRFLEAQVAQLQGQEPPRDGLAEMAEAQSEADAADDITEAVGSAPVNPETTPQLTQEESRFAGLDLDD